MTLLFPVKHDATLLPFFLTYYRRLGITRFVCALCNGRENPVWLQVREWTDQVDVRFWYCDDAVYCGPLEARALERIRRTLPGPWHVVVDLDEFYWLPDRMTLPELVLRLDRGGYAGAHCSLVDRVAAGGLLVSPGYSLEASYPLACDLTRTLGANCHKVPVVQAGVKLLSGHHRLAGARPCLDIGELHHFKWRLGVESYLRARYKTLLGLRLAWAKESLDGAERCAGGRVRLDGLRIWIPPALGI